MAASVCWCHLGLAVLGGCGLIVCGNDPVVVSAGRCKQDDNAPSCVTVGDTDSLVDVILEIYAYLLVIAFWQVGSYLVSMGVNRVISDPRDVI